MTYQSEILSDAPLVYYRTDEGSGSTFANSGSLGGTGTVSTNIAKQVAPAGTIDGYSFGINSGVTNSISQSLGTAPTAWTFEIWFKNNAGTTNSNLQQLAKIQTATNNYVALYYRPSDAYLRAYDVAGTLNGGPTGTAATISLRDGNWHHIAATKNGSTVTFYIDGVSAGSTTGTSTSKTTATFYVGNNVAAESYSCYMDEPALYPALLTPTRIAAHYAAGSAPSSTAITVGAPVMTSNSITMPAPVVTALDGRISIHATPPAITASLTAPVPVVSALRSIKVSAPAASLSLLTRTPTVTPYAVQTKNYAITEDRTGGSSASPTLNRDAETIPLRTSFNNSNDRQALIRAAGAPVGSGVSSAILHINIAFASPEDAAIAASTGLQISPVFVTWTEAGTENESANNTPAISLKALPGENVIDITSIMATPGITGIKVRNNTANGSSYEMYSSEATNSSLRPYIVITAPVPNVGGPELRVTPPAATLSLTAPAVGFKTGTGQRVQPASASLSVTTIAPANIVAGVAARALTPVMTASVAFPGGFAANPDTTKYASALEISVSAPNAAIEIRSPKTVTVTGAMELTLNVIPMSKLNLETNKLTKVFGAMTMRIKNVGIYQKENDRYYKQVLKTVGPEDVWFEMEEKTGQIAKDSVYGAFIDNTGTANDFYSWQSNGFYHSGIDNPAPILGLDGPRLRKGAVRFDGIKQWFSPGNYESNVQESTQLNQPTNNIIDGRLGQTGSWDADFEMTVEFSIRTTQLDGVIFAGSGAQSASKSRLVFNAATGAYYTGYEVALENGYIVITNGVGDYKTRVRSVLISDGEWHHVIIAIPKRGTTIYPGQAVEKPDFIMIDGVQTVRRGGELGQAWQMLPATFMARPGKGPKHWFANFNTLDYNNMSGFLAGDLRDVIVRNDYISLDSARRLYWEWSESVLVEVEGPMALSMTGLTGHRARGNIKKMMLIFGLEQEYTLNLRSSDYMQYYSALSGITSSAGTNGGGWTRHVSWTFGTGYLQQQVFTFEDFLVFPVSIEGAYKVDHVELDKTGWIIDSYDKNNPTVSKAAKNGPSGPDGIVKEDFVDAYGNFIDDETGGRRWLDVTSDLEIPLSEWDVITVMNYPWYKPEQSRDHTISPSNSLGPVVRSQYRRFMTDGEWERARDVFRDKLLAALYQGVSFWITEPHMAEHMGFIQAYDVHDRRKLWGGKNVVSRNPALDVDWDNLRARELDFNHITKNGVHIALNHPGDYYPEPQVLFFKRIVATEADFTDMPSNDYGEMIVAWPTDDFDVVNDWMAYDIIAKPNGLQVGDLSRLNLLSEFEHDGAFATWNDIAERSLIISAKPQGIVGKVIAREQEEFYGVPGTFTKLPNPWKDNATTIIAEKGTMLHGRPIGGRVFIEFMGFGQFTRGYIPEDKNKDKWAGSAGITGVNVQQNSLYSDWDHLGSMGRDDGARSSWSFDTRRYKKVMVQWFLNKTRYNSKTGFYEVHEMLQIGDLQYEDGDYIYKPFWPIMARGLHWLSKIDTVANGFIKQVVPAMTVSLTAPAPTASKTRNISGAIPPMQVFLEIRDAKNYRSNHVREIVRGMQVAVELRGTGHTVEVPPLTLSVTMPDSQIKAGGDRIMVYLDRDDTIKLFIKEDDN